MMMMMMENNNNNNNNLMSALFPVIFFDGEREIDLGTVVITPSMNFKSFQSMMSQKIGISPHQITTYFERTPYHHHLHHRRRHPVTNKFNFSSILSEPPSSCFFWVVLKRSRRLRRRSRPKLDPTTTTPIDAAFSPENLVLLRRNPNEYMDYANRLRMEVERERERYLMSLNLNSNVYSDLSLYNNHHGRGFGLLSSDDGASSSNGGSSCDRVFCDVCLNARMEGETVPFHWCKNDAVTMVFRSPAGPIAPPSKSKLGV